MQKPCLRLQLQGTYTILSKRDHSNTMFTREVNAFLTPDIASQVASTRALIIVWSVVTDCLVVSPYFMITRTMSPSLYVRTSQGRTDNKIKEQNCTSNWSGLPHVAHGALKLYLVISRAVVFVIRPCCHIKQHKTGAGSFLLGITSHSIQHDVIQ